MPAIVFTAIAATVVLLPWAVDGKHDSSGTEVPDAAQTQLAQQPLNDLGAGETIREISQDTPFSMVALTGADLSGTSARVRAKHTDGSWGPWYDTEAVESDGGTGATPAARGTEPVYVGTTTTVQIAVHRPADAPATSAPPRGEPAKPGLGYRPATVEQPFAQNISAVLISPPRAPVDTPWAPPTAIVPMFSTATSFTLTGVPGWTAFRS